MPFLFFFAVALFKCVASLCVTLPSLTHVTFMMSRHRLYVTQLSHSKYDSSKQDGRAGKNVKTNRGYIFASTFHCIFWLIYCLNLDSWRERLWEDTIRQECFGCNVSTRGHTKKSSFESTWTQKRRNANVGHTVRRSSPKTWESDGRTNGVGKDVGYPR